MTRLGGFTDYFLTAKQAWNVQWKQNESDLSWYGPLKADLG